MPPPSPAVPGWHAAWDRREPRRWRRGGRWWTLVFSDEFDRPGAPDPAKWNDELGYIRNKEAQFYTSRPENVRAENGYLVIDSGLGVR